MLCDNCKTNEANTFYQQSINGETVEMHLCPACAGNMGVTTMFGGMNFNIDKLFTNMLGSASQGKALQEQKTCPHCSASLKEITQSGRVGCNECYAVFYDELTPIIEKTHGKVTHAGKIPSAASSALKQKAKIRTLQKELKQAIAEQAFEKAAKIRDQIKELEKDGE